MRPLSTKWKLVIASAFVGSAFLLTGCDSPSVGNEQTTPETENSTGEPADVDIDTPGLDVELNQKDDSAEVDVDIPDENKSGEFDVDVNSPE